MFLALAHRIIRLLDLSGFDVGVSMGGIVARDPTVPGRPPRTPPGVQEDDDVRWDFRRAARRLPPDGASPRRRA
jgi:hypothetical protein